MDHKFFLIEICILDRSFIFSLICILSICSMRCNNCIFYKFVPLCLILGWLFSNIFQYLNASLFDIRNRNRGRRIIVPCLVICINNRNILGLFVWWTRSLCFRNILKIFHSRGIANFIHNYLVFLIIMRIIGILIQKFKEYFICNLL